MPDVKTDMVLLQKGVVTQSFNLQTADYLLKSGGWTKVAFGRSKLTKPVKPAQVTSTEKED